MDNVRETGRKARQTATHLSKSTRTRIQLAAILIFVIILAVAMFLRGGFIGPEMILLGLLLGAVVLGQLFKFIRDWLPFVFILLVWQMLRGYADNAATGGGFPLHVGEMVHWDRFLFGGHLPTLTLQEALYTPGQAHWYDVATTMFWAFHFVLPLLFAFYLWATRRHIYWKFVSCLVLLSFAGFATYVLFPAAPPWYASSVGVINHPVYLIRVDVLNNLHVNVADSLSWIMLQGNPDPVAAMPSLHAAYPTTVFWFCLFYWRKAIPFAVMYCLGLWFSIVYIGDHYVVDALAGIIYSTAAFFTVHGAIRLYSRYRKERSPARSQAVKT